MAGMTIQASNRVLGIGLADDVGHGGVGRPDIGRAAGVMAKSAITLMLDQDIVPGGQGPVTVVVTGGAGLPVKSVSAEADGVTSATAAGPMLVVGEITDMTPDTLAIGRRGVGGRALQRPIASQIMTGGATAFGMGLPNPNEGRNRGRMATLTVVGRRGQGQIGGHRAGMVMGMATKIGGMAVGTGRGGLPVTKGDTFRVTPDAGNVQEIANIGPQERGVAVTGETAIAMHGQRIIGLMLMAVGAGRGVDQEAMGRQRRLEPLGGIMAIGAFLIGIMAVVQRILGPVRRVDVANLAEPLAWGPLIGQPPLGIKGVRVKKADRPLFRQRR